MKKEISYIPIKDILHLYNADDAWNIHQNINRDFWNPFSGLTLITQDMFKDSVSDLNDLDLSILDRVFNEDKNIYINVTGEP